MSKDDLDHMPTIVPGREGPAGRGPQTGAARKRTVNTPPPKPQGSGLLLKLCVLVAIAVGAGACAWAFRLHTQLQSTEEQMAGYALRIADLEDRLSDTDEGMNQNAAVQAVKIAELESEVRKLWDNVWKKAKARLDKLEASSGSHDKSIAALGGSVSGIEQQLDAINTDIGALRSVAGDLSRLMTSARSNQAEVERVADALNRIDLDLARLSKRVEGNEEWVGSINAFRRQVNASLAELQSAVRSQGGSIP